MRPTINQSTTTTTRESRKQTGKNLPVEEVITEVLYENQRGTAFFQQPKFSKKSLLPTDYSPWSDETGKFRLSKELLEPPLNREWISEWILDMNGDVDPGGWKYSFQFHNANSPKWTCIASGTSYVRQRKWVRMAKKVEKSKRANNSLPLLKDQKMMLTLDIIGLLQRCKVDRERLATIINFFDKNGIETCQGKFDTIFMMFETECSRVHYLKVIKERLKDGDRLSFMKMVNKLKYYSDRSFFSSVMYY